MPLDCILNLGFYNLDCLMVEPMLITELHSEQIRILILPTSLECLPHADSLGLFISDIDFNGGDDWLLLEVMGWYVGVS